MSRMTCLKRFSIFEVAQKLQPNCDLEEGVKDPEHSHPGLALTHTLAVGKIGVFFVFSTSPKKMLSNKINKTRGAPAKQAGEEDGTERGGKLSITFC